MAPILELQNLEVRFHTLDGIVHAVNGVSYQVARHSVWGLHIAMTVGMPQHVAHIITSHSFEGGLIMRSPEAWVVHHADEIWWDQIAREALGTPRERERLSSYRRQLDWQKK